MPPSHGSDGFGEAELLLLDRRDAVVLADALGMRGEISACFSSKIFSDVDSIDVLAGGATLLMDLRLDSGGFGICIPCRRLLSDPKLRPVALRMLRRSWGLLLSGLAGGALWRVVDDGTSSRAWLAAFCLVGLLLLPVLVVFVAILAWIAPALFGFLERKRKSREGRLFAGFSDLAAQIFAIVLSAPGMSLLFLGGSCATWKKRVPSRFGFEAASAHETLEILAAERWRGRAGGTGRAGKD